LAVEGLAKKRVSENEIHSDGGKNVNVKGTAT